MCRKQKLRRTNLFTYIFLLGRKLLSLPTCPGVRGLLSPPFLKGFLILFTFPVYGKFLIITDPETQVFSATEQLRKFLPPVGISEGWWV